MYNTLILKIEMRKEAEEKKIVQETQAGFRKMKLCVGNTLKCTVENKIMGKSEKLLVFFTDLRPDFDRVDRRTLRKVLERRRVRKSLIERVKDIYEDTKNVVKVGEIKTNRIGVTEEVRQS